MKIDRNHKPAEYKNTMTIKGFGSKNYIGGGLTVIDQTSIFPDVEFEEWPESEKEVLKVIQPIPETLEFPIEIKDLDHIFRCLSKIGCNNCLNSKCDYWNNEVVEDEKVKEKIDKIINEVEEIIPYLIDKVE